MKQKAHIVNTRGNRNLREAKETLLGKKDYIKYWRGKYPWSARIVILILILGNGFQYHLSHPEILDQIIKFIQGMIR